MVIPLGDKNSTGSGLDPMVVHEQLWNKGRLKIIWETHYTTITMITNALRYFTTCSIKPYNNGLNGEVKRFWIDL